MDNLITISDEEFDRLHNEIFPDIENIEYKWSRDDVVAYFEKHTGLEWGICDENLNQGTVTLKIIDKQKFILTKLKFDL